MRRYIPILAIALFAHIVFSALPCNSQVKTPEGSLDEKVERFLNKMKSRWRDYNVPEEDGRILHDIIVKNKYKNALEVGTSTGHSAIWIAWALSKTGGRLITIEIDEGRYRQAVANFKEAGLSQYIDARHADAHRLVKELPGTFDFVFIDADKDWYTQYAKDLVPKLEPGGCIAAHNVVEPRSHRSGGYWSGTEEYYEYMKSLPEFETGIHPRSSAGLSLSFKRSNPNATGGRNQRDE
jgi:predicted O-methyltransferase YrrM